MNANKYDLEERLIKFTCLIIEIVNETPRTRAGLYFGGQLLRSGSSPSLNYGEAQSAESRKDFIHKIKVILKELRETNICLSILLRVKLYKTVSNLETAIDECNQLISIFVKSVSTAEKNSIKK